MESHLDEYPSAWIWLMTILILHIVTPDLASLA